MAEAIRVEDDGAVRHLVLSRPDDLNTITPQLRDHLDQALRAADADKTVKVRALRQDLRHAALDLQAARPPPLKVSAGWPELKRSAGGKCARARPAFRRLRPTAPVTHPLHWHGALACCASPTADEPQDFGAGASAARGGPAGPTDHCRERAITRTGPADAGVAQAADPTGGAGPADEADQHLGEQAVERATLRR